MTDPQNPETSRAEDEPALPDDPVDQDAEPTMTAPAENRPDGGTQDPRGDSPDVADADGEG
ncbi:hypothetical protein ACQP04_21115 [Pseudonocardia halophobica]|uniref:hypothetical protein n=1 Tax=Pseudonocardia halophobica TaxID=29401 RepID=UPI003D8B683C